MSDCIPRVLSAIKDKVPCRVYTLGLTCKQISMQTQMYVNNKKSIVWEYSVSIIAFLSSQPLSTGKKPEGSACGEPPDCLSILTPCRL